jgi:D-3-phosphoglycerate dehydrogenase / 2-oxoglutarate reductase
VNARLVHADAAQGAVLPVERSVLAQAGVDLYCAGAVDADGIIAAGRDADVLLVDNAVIDQKVMEGLARCQAIIRYGIGYDSVDTRAATEHGIIVVNIPAFCIEEVANHTLLLLLACWKKLIRLDHDIRSGNWPDNRNLESALAPVGSVYGQRLGLIGFGNIARAVSLRGKTLGMRVTAFDPFVEVAEFTKHGAEPASLDEVIQESDFLSLHVPLTPETHHLMNAARLRHMKESAYLINTSRGGVVDQEALVRALREKWIVGAGLDVFEQEPLPSDSPLLAMENVVMTPHVASYTDAAFARLRARVAEEAVRVISGEWPTAIVNPEVKGHSRFERRQSNAW